MILALILVMMGGAIGGTLITYACLEPELRKSQAAATATQIQLDGLHAAQRIEAAAYLTERRMYHSADGPDDWQPTA